MTDTIKSALACLLFALFMFSASCSKPDPNQIERAPPMGRVSILTFPGEDIWPTDVFSSRGAYKGRMDLPYPARTQKIFGEYIYAIVFREEGIPTLTRYRLEPADGVEE